MSVTGGHKTPCVVCALRPLTTFGRYFGFSPVTANCATTTKPSVYRTSKLWIFISLINAGIMFGMIFFTLEDFHNNHISSMSTDAIQHVIVVIDCMNLVTSIVLIFINIFQSNSRSKALNTIAKLMHSPKNGIERSISEANEKSLRRSSYQQIASVFLLVLLQNLLTIAAVWRDNSGYLWRFILKSISFSISNGVFMMIGLEFSILASYIRFMMCEVSNRLSYILMALSNTTLLLNMDQSYISEVPEKKKNVWTVNIIIESISKPKDRSMKMNGRERHMCLLGQCRLGYYDATKCLRLLNRSMNPQLAILTVLVLVTIVLNTYVIIHFIILGNGNILFFVTVLRLFVMFGTVLHMISRAELLKITVKILLTFVYKLNSRLN